MKVEQKTWGPDLPAGVAGGLGDLLPDLLATFYESVSGDWGPDLPAGGAGGWHEVLGECSSCWVAI